MRQLPVTATARTFCIAEESHFKCVQLCNYLKPISDAEALRVFDS